MVNIPLYLLPQNNLVRQSLQRCNLKCYIPSISLFSTNLQTNTNTEDDKLYRVVELELKGNDPAVLKSFMTFASTAGKHLDIQSTTWTLRKPKHEKYTVLKSVHIYKKHRVQYELRTYFSFVQFKYLTGSTADTLLEYLERNLPEGVALKASKVEMQQLPEYIVPS